MNKVYVFILSALALISCSDNSETEEIVEKDVVTRYINFTISVGSSSEPSTRAYGEDGDIREDGRIAENEVTGVTVLLYEDAAGINTTANPPIVYSKYFTTSLVSRETEGGNHNVEAVYTTGNQKFTEAELDLEKTYHTIIIANKNLATTFPTGTALNVVKNYVCNEISGYSTAVSSSTYNPYNASNFIMASESDVSFKLSSLTIQYINSSDPMEGIIYPVTVMPVERLAARIDFWAKNGIIPTTGSIYYTEKAHTNLIPAKYVYIATDDNYLFAMTDVIPFNIQDKNGTSSKEYLVKHLADAITDPVVPQYLTDETSINYVVDPRTVTKGGGYFTDYYNTLKVVNGTADPTNNLLSMDAGRYRSYTEDGKTANSHLICYAMENTLWSSSSLAGYATGLIIKGKLYQKQTDSGITWYETITDPDRTYYNFIRHHGPDYGYTKTSSAYTTLDPTNTAGTTPMEFGIVRNNLYRIYINKVIYPTPGDAEININIKVKKWKVKTHSTIEM